MKFRFKHKHDRSPTVDQWAEFIKQFKLVYGNLPDKTDVCFKRHREKPLRIFSEYGYKVERDLVHICNEYCVVFQGDVSEDNNGDLFEFLKEIESEHPKDENGYIVCDTNGKSYGFLVMLTLLLAHNFMPEVYDIKTRYVSPFEWDEVRVFAESVIGSSLDLPAGVWLSAQKPKKTEPSNEFSDWSLLIPSDEPSFYF